MSQSISIETAYNVTVDYELASAWDRTWAYLIDQLILFGYITLLIYIVSSFDRHERDYFFSDFGYSFDAVNNYNSDKNC